MTMTINLDVMIEGYRAQKAKIEKLRGELAAKEQSGEPIPDATTNQVEKTESQLHQLSARLIALQNDRFRTTLTGGQVLLTQGVDAGGAEFVTKAMLAVQALNIFDGDNDPYGEHDFGAFETLGHKLFFKIDAYDPSMQYGSPDPVLPECTRRVLTIMLASEY